MFFFREFWQNSGLVHLKEGEPILYETLGHEQNKRFLNMVIWETPYGINQRLFKRALCRTFTNPVTIFLNILNRKCHPIVIQYIKDSSVYFHCMLCCASRSMLMWNEADQNRSTIYDSRMVFRMSKLIKMGLISFRLVHTSLRLRLNLQIPMADPGFSWGAPTPEGVCQPINWQNVSSKLHKNEINWTKGCARFADFYAKF